MIDKFREERLGEAESRASALVSLIDALGADATAEDIERASLVPLLPAAAQAAFNVAVLALMQMDTLAAILAGSCSEERIEMLANFVWPMSAAPKARARRPRRRGPGVQRRSLRGEQPGQR